jgi:hypothetical protein
VAGDAAASALLADLLGWARRPHTRFERTAGDAGDGREVQVYAFPGRG